MSEQSGSEQPNEDESVRVREQTANDLGSPDAFGPDDTASGGTASGDTEDAAARYQVPED